MRMYVSLHIFDISGVYFCGKSAVNVFRHTLIEAETILFLILIYLLDHNLLEYPLLHLVGRALLINATMPNGQQPAWALSIQASMHTLPLS